jgi:hypothetical protein
MNKILHLIILNLLFINALKSQVLDVKLVTQEQSQWCWVAVTKCVLNYYGDSVDQCSIAEYTRNMATWHNFGSQNCCTLPAEECNYWNYNWGQSGSIQDILLHFGKIQTAGKSDSLTIKEISIEITKNHPFIIRWAWTSGGGHFMVGHGIKDDFIYYMDPLPGEGFKIARYDWVVSGYGHHWKGTNLIRTDPKPNAVAKLVNDKQIRIYPNPSTGIITIEMDPGSGRYSIEVFSISGQTVFYGNYEYPLDKITLNLSDLSNGLYFVSIKSERLRVISKILINR